MIKFTRWVVKHPKTTIGIILLITLFFGYQMKNIRMDPDITSSLPKHIPAKLLYDRMTKIFPSRDFVLIAYESDSLFSPKALKNIFAITQHLKDMPDVYSVMSPTNIKVIRGTQEGMEVRPILNAPPKTAREVQKYRYVLFHSDLPIENIISKDRRMAGIMVFLKNTVKPEDAAKEVLDYVQSLKLKKDHIYVTGKPVLTLYLGRGMGRDMGMLFPMVLLLIILILWISFRNFQGVLLPLGVVLISVLWTIGLMAFLGVPISHSTNMLPILLSAIAVADGIHILNHYFNRILHEKRTPGEVITDVMAELNAPVIITSVTTAFGFLALNTSSIGSVGQLGFFTATGVIFAMIFSLSFIPAAVTLMKIPKHIRRTEKEGRLLNRWAVAYADFLIRRKGLMAGIIVGIIVLSVLGWPRIKLENNTIDNFPKNHPARVDFEKINKNFGGTTFLSIMVEGDSAGQIKEPKVLKQMVALEKFLKKNPHVGGTLSIADFIKRMNKVMHANDSAYDCIPDEMVREKGVQWVKENGRWVEKPVTFNVPGREVIAQYLQLYEMSGKPDDFANLVDYAYKTARINAFLDTESSNVLRNLDHQVRSWIKAHFNSARVELTGTSELFLAINDLVVKGQFYSILVSLLLVIGVTSILFRSVRIGLFNAIPLFFAMIFNFGFMGWAGIPLNIVTMLTSSIAIGVGVDYAVHLIHRYRLESARTIPEAIRLTLKDAGVPIILNALTVGLGFAVLMFSIFTGVEEMGLLIAIAMFTSCFGAIAILPVMFLIFNINLKKRNIGK